MPDEEAKLLPGLSAVEEAEHRAYRRGQEAAELKGELQHHFSEDDRRFGELKTEQQQTTATLKTVGEKVETLTDNVKTTGAIAAARAEDAKKAADNAISSRQFFLGLAGLAITIVAAILTALAASGHL